MVNENKRGCGKKRKKISILTPQIVIIALTPGLGSGS
jgi:hypothetical protein